MPHGSGEAPATRTHRPLRCEIVDLIGHLEIGPMWFLAVLAVASSRRRRAPGSA